MSGASASRFNPGQYGFFMHQSPASATATAVRSAASGRSSAVQHVTAGTSSSSSTASSHMSSTSARVAAAAAGYPTASAMQAETPFAHPFGSFSGIFDNIIYHIFMKT
jgi:hypothetical protein